MNYEDLVNEIIDKTRLGFFPPLKTMSDTDTSDYVLGLNSVPGKITPIYVKWLWLD